jgi:hypothetical protein
LVSSGLPGTIVILPADNDLGDLDPCVAQRLHCGFQIGFSDHGRAAHRRYSDIVGFPLPVFSALSLARLLLPLLAAPGERQHPGAARPKPIERGLLRTALRL